MSDDKQIHKSSFLVPKNLKRRKLGTRKRINGTWFVWTEKGWKLEEPRLEGKTWD